MPLITKIRKGLARTKKKNFYARFIREGDLCFDIGANIGEKSALFLSLGARVVAVEPQTRCMPALDALKRKYKDRFTIVKAAVADEPGHAEIHLGNVSEVSTLSKEFMKQFGMGGQLTWNEKENVEVITIGELISDHGVPDVCKIDTEGFEEKVFAGLKQRINTIEFEFTPPFILQTKACIGKCALLGEATFNYNIYEQPVLQQKKWMDGQEMLKQLDRISPNIIHGNIFVRYT